MCDMTGEYQNVDGICEIMDVFEIEGMSRINEKIILGSMRETDVIGQNF